MRKIGLIFFAIIITLCVSAQRKDLKPLLYKLEGRIMGGDINALKELAVFIDDTSFVQEFLGHHNYPNNARRIALRVISENCLFSNEEFKIDSTVSTIKFLNLFRDNKVVFDDITGSFLIKPLAERSTEYQLKELSKQDIEKINTSLIKHPFPEWYYENQVDWLIKRKNSDALMWIASAWYKKRPRFNMYYFNDDEFLDLIKNLTHLDLGVPDEKGKITFLYKDDYYAKARLNYLNYWVNHSKDYSWNEEKGYFENKSDKATAKSNEEVLFTLLNSKNDSTAMAAFTQLTELDTGRVNKLANEYESNRIDRNYSIPTFPYRFLKQMVFLTQYCRDNNIKYKPEGWLLDSLKRLRLNLTFNERYKLENDIIEKLAPEQVTMVEYHGLIHQQEWSQTYSIGRILDKFYSKKWNAITTDESQLQLYLKKANWFNRLGIIGICYSYVRKFENAETTVLDKVKLLVNKNDPDITHQAKIILSIYSSPIVKKADSPQTWAGNNINYGVIDLEPKYRAIHKNKMKRDDKRYKLLELFGQISYRQLGEAIELLMKDTILEYSVKFDLLENDFGLTIESSSSNSITEFIFQYKAKTEYQLYEYYLKKTGLNCFDSKGNLHFPNVYEILKYDIVDAFAGGGGSRRDEGVYLVIKLLEFKFNETLGFPKKLCSWQGIYSCNCADRARAWMLYLTENKLVLVDKNEPISIANKD